MHPADHVLHVLRTRCVRFTEPMFRLTDEDGEVSFQWAHDFLLTVHAHDYVTFIPPRGLLVTALSEADMCTTFDTFSDRLETPAQ